MIWTVAPEAYCERILATTQAHIGTQKPALLRHRLTQKGPETPYRYATPEDCSSVAAHVHDETTADATRPDLTVLPAVLNISEV